MRCKVDEFQSYYPNPRKGTETPPRTEILLCGAVASYYPNPCKGTETLLFQATRTTDAWRRITQIPVRGLKLHRNTDAAKLFVSYYPNPRKGTETTAGHKYRIYRFRSYYPNPRKGTETHPESVAYPANFILSYYPNPRKGTETPRLFARVRTGSVLKSYYPNPRS